QGQAAAFDGEGIDVEQAYPALWVASLENGAQHAGAAAKVQQVSGGKAVEPFQQQGAAAIQAAMAEHAGQADDLQRAVGQEQFKALRQAVQIRGGGRIAHRHLPQLAVACTVQFAWLAVGGQLFGCALDTATLFADQIQIASAQTSGQSLQQVVGELARLGQEQYGAGKGRLGRLGAEVATPGEARIQNALLAGMPAPAMGVRQLAEQVVGRQA